MMSDVIADWCQSIAVWRQTTHALCTHTTNLLSLCTQHCQSETDKIGNGNVCTTLYKIAVSNLSHTTHCRSHACCIVQHCTQYFRWCLWRWTRCRGSTQSGQLIVQAGRYKFGCPPQTKKWLTVIQSSTPDKKKKLTTRLCFFDLSFFWNEMCTKMWLSLYSPHTQCTVLPVCVLCTQRTSPSENEKVFRRQPHHHRGNH